MIVFIIFMCLVNFKDFIVLNQFLNLFRFAKIFWLFWFIFLNFNTFRKKSINSFTEFISLSEIKIKMNHLNILWFTIFVNF